MEKIELLKDILSSSKEFDFKELKNGDDVLMIKKYYNTNDVIYINFYELIHLLEHYTGIDKILLNYDEIESEL